LVETLVVIALLLGLAALALPVLQTSKARAQKSACSQNLRQLYLATELYRADWGGGEVYGSLVEMGLPFKHSAADKTVFEKLKLQSLRCSHKGKPWEQHRPDPYIYFPLPEPDESDVRPGSVALSWSKYTREYREQSILFGDVSHNPTDLPYLNPNFPISGFGITLGGSLVRQRKPGDIYSPYWWITENE